jgi:hypothetical protein
MASTVLENYVGQAIKVYMMNSGNVTERDHILFGAPINWAKRKHPPGVCERFDQLDATGAARLIEMGFLKPQSTMNATPTFQTLVDFARSMQTAGFSFGLEGFTYDPSRYDGEVVIDGISYQGDYPAEIGLEFARFIIPYRPDEASLEPNYLRAWWD